MGLEHLKKIEQLLYANKAEAFSLRRIRELLSMNHYTAKEALSYLLKEKKIAEIEVENDTNEETKTKYQWRRTNEHKGHKGSIKRKG